MCTLFKDVRKFAFVGIYQLVFGDAEGYGFCDFPTLSTPDCPYYSWRDKAEEVMNEIGILECVGAVVSNELIEKGGVYLDVSDPTQVLNALFNIMLSKLVFEVYSDTPYYDKPELTHEDYPVVKTILANWFKATPEGINNIWLELPTNTREAQFTLNSQRVAR